MPDRSRLPTIDAHILPIFLARTAPDLHLLSPEGTGFLAADNLVVTCWHCVREDPREGQAYVALVLPRGAERYEPRVLENVSQDRAGSDLATANIDHRPDLQFELAKREPRHGARVWTFGYPFTDTARTGSGDLLFTLNPRRLQGYVTRPWIYQSKEYGEIDSYELDMPTPQGLSGAPLMIDEDSLLVGGVVYGSYDVARIDEFARVDPDTKERTPEIQRIVSFGLAHSLRSLRSLAGRATGDRPLEEVMRSS